METITFFRVLPFAWCMLYSINMLINENFKPRAIRVIQITSQGVWPLVCAILGGSSTTTTITESARIKDLDNGQELLCCWLYKQTFEGNYSIILSLPC